MRRRRLLGATGCLAAVGLAGCVGGQPGSPGDGPDDSPTDSPTAPDTPAAPTRPPTSFAVTSVRCGDQLNRADVSLGHDVVTVEGATWGNDACYTARLDSATLDGGTLTVRVVAVSTADDEESCAQCITEIAYRATVEVGPTPEEVVVVHDGETVATARP